MEKGLAVMDKALEGKEYLAGKFSVADAALFYVSFWAAGRMKMPLPKNVAAHYERMKARPAVKRVLEQGRPLGRGLISLREFPDRRASRGGPTPVALLATCALS